MSSNLIEIATYVTKWSVSLIVILGIVANSLNITILLRANLKKHSCILYFITLSINNLLYTITCITSNLLADGFAINLESYSSSFCKLSTFLLNFCPHFSVYMLILASIDRYLSSSLNPLKRNLSNIRIARWLILIVLIFTIIFTIGNVIVVNTYSNGINICSSNTNTLFNQFLRTTQVISYVIISPLLMIIFGLLTIHNTNNFTQNHLITLHYRRNERQLTRMLIVQVSTHVVLSLPFCVLFFMTIIPIEFTSTIMFYFLLILFKIPFYITFITPFFLYILSAKLYRTEFILLLKKIIQIHRNRIIHPMTN